MTDTLCHLVVRGNDVVDLKLVRSEEDIENDELNFRPEMCHQIFGENENIFGYTNLQIKLYYSAGSLQTYLGIDYSDKIEPTGFDGMKADDVGAALRKVLAPGYTGNLDNFLSLVKKDETFKPFGELVHSFRCLSRDRKKMKIFEVYYCDTTNTEFLAYHQRLQTFLLWYVDAASFIDVDDDQWCFFTVYEKCPSTGGGWRYYTAAYATVYRFYAYPTHKRPRISQVLTLPPFQKLGICAKLLTAIYNHFIPMPEVLDITFEDPTDQIQRIRDYIDCRNLERLPAFSPSWLSRGYNPEMACQANQMFKVNKKQARRVYEILRLKNTNTFDKDAYLAYRLNVKNRLNGPFQKKKLDMKKLQKVLNPAEYAATLNTTNLSETHGRLSSQYLALENAYRRVIYRLEMD